MSFPNQNPHVFVPGKVIQVRDRNNPLMISKLVFISVEEHIRHVTEMLEWLFPDATEIQKAGAKLHDVGKKSGGKVILKGVKPDDKRQVLLNDFYGGEFHGRELTVEETTRWYCEDFLMIKNGAVSPESKRVRLWAISNAEEIRMDVDPPFGNHAADARLQDIEPYVQSGGFQDQVEAADHILNLVRLHHSFQPDRIIPACARHGESIVRDLYRIIVADHMGSRWAEYVVQQLESGLEKPERADFFGDLEVAVQTEAESQQAQGGLMAGVVSLLDKSGGTISPFTLLVRYHPVQINLDLKKCLGDRKAGHKRGIQQ